MEQSVLTITCTTCQARLVVRDEAILGTIAACPRCGSLVHVVAPDASKAAGAGAASAPVQSKKARAPAAVAAVASAPSPDPDVPVQVATSVSPLEVFRHRWFVLGAAPATGFALVVALASVFLAGGNDTAPSVEASQVAASAEPAQVLLPDVPSASEPAPVVADHWPSYATQQLPPSPGLADPSLRYVSHEVESAAPSAADSFSTSDRPSYSPQIQWAGADAATRAKLSQPIAAIVFCDTPLREALTTLGNLAALRVELDPAVLAKANTLPDAPVTVRLTATTVGQALDTLLAQQGLALAVQGSRLVVTTAEKR